MKLKILLLSLKDLLSEYAGEVGRTIVNGYDTKLLQYVVETALTNFASSSKKTEESVVAKPKKCGKRKGREEGKTSKPLPMDESVEKEMKELKESDEHGYALPGCREVGRIIVREYDARGYDASLPEDVVETALRNLFSSCGMITDVYVLCERSFMYFIGEGAVEKALLLNDTDVDGGWTVTVKADPFSPDAKHIVSLTVEGYDTSYNSTIEIERALIDLFSSCVAVRTINVSESSADLIVKGEDAGEKVLKLDGSSFMEHHNLVVRNVRYFKIRTFHRRGSYC